MAKQTINIGTGPNTKTGDPLRTAFNKINQNFTELYDGTGGGNTGAITFEGIAIIGDTTDLPQGSIELVPNSGTIPTGQPNEGDLYTSWGQYLRIYPTWNADAPHIHIAAGSGENSAGDLFLGNDLKYVQVNHNGTISIGNSIGEWKFYDAEGMSVLELPNNTTTTPTAEIIHRHGDLNIRTTRTSFGIDADIGIYAADDLWLTAEGDEVEITAANDIVMFAGNSEMDTNIYSVTSGTWAGTTLTFTAQGATLVQQMTQYLSGTYPIWFEIQDGETTRWVQAVTTGNVNATVAEFPTYTAAIDQTNVEATYTVLSIKPRDLNYTGSKAWAFERNGKLSLPMGGAIEPAGMGWTGLTNGTSETPVSIAYKTNTNIWQSSITLFGGNATDGTGYISLYTYNTVADSGYQWTFTENGAVTFPTLTVPINDNANPSGTGQTLKFGDASQQAIIYGPESTAGNISAERIIIQGAPGYEGTSGEGGDVYVWAGPGGDADGNGGDIKVRAGQGDGSGGGGYLNLQAGDSSTGNGGYINIESGQSNTYGSGGDITIWAHDGGDITLRTHNSITSLNWVFKADGSLQSPAGGLGVLKTIQSVNTGGLPPIDITGNVVFADANAAGDHITLLLPQSPPTGAEVTVKNINSGGFSVNVLASTDDSVAIEALDGTISTTAFGILYGSCHATWIYDGATWRIIDRYTT